ncbi:MAG: VOC family protein [Candidatus Eisenbacteria bacterium]|nr:VOC family protein [Candidatus Eisenbacteria bacterium]
MATTTTHAPGTFCWPELSTTDQAGAKKFYSALFGWEMNDSPMGEGEFYTMIGLGGRGVGALYTMRKEEKSSGAPPHWNSYVAVESADAAAARAKQLGATILADAFDVMDVGRMAIIQDPTGAVFCVWEAKKHTGAGVLGEPGSLCWTELMTRDTAKAGAFYTALFGWKTDVMTMGPMSYTVFKRDDTGAGGMMAISPDMGQVPPNWMPYFAVTDTDAIVAKANQVGGRVIAPAQDVPNVGRFAVLQDPQSAVFAVLTPPRA